MAEDKHEFIVPPKAVGLKPPSKTTEFVEKTLTSYLPKTEFDTLVEKQKQAKEEVNAVLYKEVFSPDYKGEIPSEQTERNRQILLWAIEKNIFIPHKYLAQKEYGTVPTEEILNQVFSPEQIYELHGVLVYQRARGIKDMAKENSAAFGGVMYSQSLIDEGRDGKIVGFINREFLATHGFTEPGITPGVLRKNVKGAIHVLPYGVAGKLPGKEKETLLMLADDFIHLLDYLKTSEPMGYPRFVLNGTNELMAEAAKKYANAQVEEMSSLDNFVSSFWESLGSGQSSSQKVLKVFISEDALKKGKEKMVPLRDSLLKLLSARKNLKPEELMKQIRIEAISTVCERLSFTDLYRANAMSYSK